MKRRDFFKAVTGFVAGAVVAVMPKAIGSKRSGTRPVTKEDFQNVLNEVVEDKLKCGGQHGTLCPRCKFNYPELTNAETQIVYFSKDTYNLTYAIDIKDCQLKGI